MARRTASSKMTVKKKLGDETSGGSEEQDDFGFKALGSPKTDKLSTVRTALKQVFKNEEYIKDYDPSQLREPMPHLSTGIVAMDYLIGGEKNRFGCSPCPGFPRGKLTQIWGAEHSGKTTVCLEAAAQCIREGGQVLYVDWEYAIDPAYASSLIGTAISNKEWFLWAQPETLEEGFQIISACAFVGVELIVIDSVGAAILKAHDEQGLKDKGGAGTGGAGMGAASRRWSDFLPQLKKMVAKSGTALVAISQTRATMSTGYGPKTSPQGGNAWKFYADLRIELRKVKSHNAKALNAMTNKVEELPYANTVQAKLAKCKISPNTGRTVDFYLRLGVGVDNLWTLMDLAKAHGIIKGANWMTWIRPNGEEVKEQGMTKFRARLTGDPVLLQDFQDQVLPLLSASAGASEDDSEDEDSNDAVMATLIAMQKSQKSKDAEGDGDEDDEGGSTPFEEDEE